MNAVETVDAVHPLHAQFPVMLNILIRMQVARLRRSWRPYVIVSAVMPAGIVLLLNLVAPTMPTSARIQVILGAVVLSQSIVGIVMLSQQVAWLKASKALDHYRVLPVSLSTLILAMTVVYSLFAWPGILLIGLEGNLLDHLHLIWNPALLPVLLLEGVALGSLGTIVGLLAPDEGLAGLIGNLLMMGVLFGGMVPLNSLTMKILLWCLPSTYGLQLLNLGATGEPGNWFVPGLGLLFYAGLGWFLATWLMRRPAR